MEMSLEKASEEYVFRRKHGKIHIKKYIGKGGKIEIPQFIGGMPVTKIDFFAFSGSGVTEVIIPDGIRFIGTAAFSRCKKLKKVALLGKIDKCDYNVFYDSALEEIEGIEFLSGTHINIGSFKKTPFYEANQTLIIGDKLIWCRDDSEVINVPDRVRRIGYCAFWSSKAKKIVLPKGLIEIGNLAFLSAGIEEIDIPDSVERVGTGALSDCRLLKEIRLPLDFGRRIGWSDFLDLSNKVINDTQIDPPSDDDVLVYDDVSCIVCSDAMRYSPYRVREKQVFPKRLEYLKYAGLLLSAKVNVLRNDTFIVGVRAKDNVDFPGFGSNLERRFTIVFELDNVCAEVLFWLPFVPYWRRRGCNSPKRYTLTGFYKRCLVNCKDGRFFDFEEYDGHILEQDIPFRIKAEIAYKRFSSSYRLSDEAKENYKRYFTFHRKKLRAVLDKLQDEDMKRFFTETIL